LAPFLFINKLLSFAFKLFCENNNNENNKKRYHHHCCRFFSIFHLFFYFVLSFSPSHSCDNK